MNIELVKIHFKEKQVGRVSTYKYLPFKYCCDKLKNFEHIEFCAELDGIDSNDGIDDEDNVIPRFAFYVEEPQAWEEDTWPTYYKIDYCPFCGEKINIKVTNDIDKSALYEKYNKEYHDFRDKAAKTDSVKEKKELEAKEREALRKVDNLWKFGEYHEYE